MTVPYLNRQLFSDHWLRERLPQHDNFALTPLSLAKLALLVRGLATGTVAAKAWSAQETLEHVVAPCLALLGYPTGAGAWMTAQLTLWSDQAELFWQRVPLAATPSGSPQHALVGVVPWDTELDGHSSAQTRRSPSVAAPTLLFLRQLANGEAAWGILTNGRRWRLCYRDSDTLEAAYEIDLLALATADDMDAVDALKYFWLFFAASAQTPSDDGELSFLQVALRESREYAARIEDDLRRRAFSAIQAACQALADALASERGIPASLLARDDLAEVYADALALLYRMLFVLFAESRSLLPIHNASYASDYSLREVIARLPTQLDDDGGVNVTDLGFPIWPRLERLFRALNGENHSSVVPIFSGRLFDGALHPLLSRLMLADEPLARMLILLGRTLQGQQIDYADLAVRQLGSIYEGLLEHQAIAVAVDEMALAKGPKDKAALIVRREDAGGRRILETYPVGTVYLSNDKGERHAAGTYYTPEPVVRYLVEETLSPLVAGKTPEQILALRVLDPAMGSAHFLVAAVDFLTRAVLAAQERHPSAPNAHMKSTGDNGHEAAANNDVMELKRRVAEQCVYGVDVNEAAVELGKLSLWLATAAKDRPLTFLDLHLRVGNSLIGLAPGELEAATEQRPTASAVRKRSASRKAAPPTLPHTDADQPTLWNETAYTQAMFKVVGAARVVDLMPTDTVEAARSKLHVSHEIQRETYRFREAADLAVSLRLGAPIAPEHYRAAMATLLGQSVFRLADATLGNALDEAHRARERHTLFHWELEFPEVFRDGNGQPLGANAGFDAILGNPPYVSVTTLRAADPVAWKYYPRVFASTARGQYDLYVAFVERALALLTAQGRMAYILPNKWLTTDFGSPLRALLAGRRAVSALVDFGAYQVFPNVSNYTCLLFAGCSPSDIIAVSKRTQPEGEIDLPPSPRSYTWSTGAVDARTLNDDPWNLTVGTAATIMARWDGWPVLGDTATIFSGTGTRADPVFILTEVARNGEIVTCYAPALGREVRLEAALLHPVLQGRDIQPYSYDDHHARLLSPYRLADGRATLFSADDLQARYPLTWAYLNDETVRGVLEARENGRFRGRADWYGFGYPRNMALLPEPKLVLPDVAARGRVAWDTTGHDIVDTAYGIVLRPESQYAPGFVLAALNHPALAFFLRHRGTDLRGGYFRMKTAYLNPFPLPPLACSLHEGERRAQAAFAGERVQAGLRAGQPARQIAASQKEQPAEVLHDVVAALAGHMGDLAMREQTVWRTFAARVATLRPDIIGGNDEALRFDRAHTLATPDALIATFTRQGAPLSAPELAAIRTEHGAMRGMLTASQREREATVAVIDQLLYRLYRLTEDEISIIEGSDQPVQLASDTLSYRNRRPQRGAAGEGERILTQQEVPGTMRKITKGGQPVMVARCVGQALANPYSNGAAMNEAMGYTAGSDVGPHYLNMAILTGLLTETPQGWPRPTQAGRELVARDSGAGEDDDADKNGVWDALLSLPAYRRFLEYKALTLAQRNRPYYLNIASQIEAAVYDAFPDFRQRAVSLQEMLQFDERTPSQTVTAMRKPPTLEPISAGTLSSWAAAQRLGSGRTDVTRATEIGRTLALAERIPLTVRSEWLTIPGQLLALLLLIAARQQRQGIVVARGAGRSGATMLREAVDSLRLCGLDIRYEQRGEALIALLIPAVTLRIASLDALDALEGMSAAVAQVDQVARVVVAAAKAGLREGMDGEMRGEVAPADLATRCAEARFDGLGEFASAHAADDVPLVESAIRIGPPLPLATDLPPLGRDYRFLTDAIHSHARGRRGQVAVLLSEWLTQQRQPPEEALNVNPHLSLLYLVAADSDHRADMLSRRGAGWYFANMPLVRALDDRLRGLGYDVWDEAYHDDELRMHALGAALVEQGLSVGALRHSDNPGAPLEAPATWGYYEAIDLLDVEPARRRRR